LVRHRTTLKNRIHATLITFGHPCPVSDLFGLTGREPLDRLEIPDPWRRNVDVSLGLIDDLELQIATLTVQLKRTGADHRYIPLLITAPGLGSINAFTVASEIGDIKRFASPAKLCGCTGLCPRVTQSGNTDRCRLACHHKAVGSSPISRFRDVRLPSGFCVPPALSTDQAVGRLCARIASVRAFVNKATNRVSTRAPAT
jgi:hypothetical protein